MQQHLLGPLWASIALLGVTGAITVACFVAMFRMLYRPGEADPRHPKHQILREDS
jgi:hypothetical protein